MRTQMHKRAIKNRQEVGLVYCTNQTKRLTRNKSNDYFESLQYRQDVRHIAHYYNRKTPLPIHVAQKITVIRAQKIGKSAV